MTTTRGFSESSNEYKANRILSRLEGLVKAYQANPKTYPVNTAMFTINNQIKQLGPLETDTSNYALEAAILVEPIMEQIS